MSSKQESAVELFWWRLTSAAAAVMALSIWGMWAFYDTEPEGPLFGCGVVLLLSGIAFCVGVFNTAICAYERAEREDRDNR